MQNKGVISVVAILFAIACIYQLSFTYVSSKVKKDAKEYALQNLSPEFDKENLSAHEFTRKDSALRALENHYIDSLSSETVYNLGVIKYTLRECQEREINLGLDLKGGMNVILEVSVVDIIQSLSGYNQDTTFTKAIALAKLKQRDSQEGFVTLFGEAFEEVDPEGRLAAIFSTPELRDKIKYNSTNEEVLDVIRDQTESAIGNSFNILRSRIDRFGVTQPTIQLLETSGRILVELPGVNDQERVRKLLQGTANLEFWETYDNTQIYQYLVSANEKIKEIQEANAELAQNDVQAEEESGESILEKAAVKDTTTEELALLEQLESDTAKTDTSMTDIGKDYPLFQKLMPNVLNNNQLGQGSVIGRAHYKDTGRVNYYLNLPQVRALFPRDFSYRWGIKSPKWDDTKSIYELYAIKITSRDGRPPLDGDVITDARVNLSQFNNEVEVSMSMNPEGAKIWARLTREAASQEPKAAVAIVLDDYVYSAPRVNEEISGGSSSISGDFTNQEAEDLANVLKSGKLPAPAKIIQEAIVGPSLGQEAIQEGLSSFLIAFVVILLYMVFYYSRKAGAVADLALIANMFFLIGVLASLGSVLTLPGIAGIVLTIGMSVDANVLIYERIREELHAGKGIRLAIADGYKNAYSAIIDANVTTLLTAIILFVFGTGPIKGFATTLLIGICTSLFSAIFLTRLVYLWFLNKGWNITFASRFTKNAFKNVSIDFISKRKIFYVLSTILIIISVISLFVRGLNNGVDFTGGRTYVVRFHKDVATTEVQNLLADAFGQAPEVKTYGASNQVKIVTQYRIDETDVEVDKEVESKLYQGLKPLFEDDVTMQDFMENYRQSSQKVGPTIADDIKVQAVWALLFSLIVVFIYILFRFKEWQYGLGAILALIHDSLIVLGIFSLFYGILPFSLEIDQAFIAAILTVIGYSINDTVVIFDRLREYIGLYPKRDRKDTINSGLNDTLSRTFSTSFSTFIVLLVIFIFGGEVIRGFIFALLVGVLVGTYSSVFIASPVMYDTIKNKKKK